MPNIKTYVEVDIDEFIDSCSSRDIKELVNILIDEGHLNGKLITSPTHHNIFDEEWVMILSKLMESRNLLSNEEETLIKNIANRF